MLIKGKTSKAFQSKLRKHYITKGNLLYMHFKTIRIKLRERSGNSHAIQISFSRNLHIH